MAKPDNYKFAATDWRAALRRNESNTRNVVILFIFIYIVTGFVMDLYFYADKGGDIQVILHDILTFKLFPIATLTMIIIAFISLLITVYFHKGMMMMGTDYHQVIVDQFQSDSERQLYNVIEELKIAASLRFMPGIYIIDADYMNAFASGFSEKSAMVAITRGLLEKLDRSELQAVMAHELSHIRHNDIRLTITVALLSNLILIALDLLFRFVLFGRRGGRDNRLVTIIILARFLLPILTVLLILYLSRTREYMADAGSVELTRNNEPLARALIKIHSDHLQNLSQYKTEYDGIANEEVRQAVYLYDPRYAGISNLKSINSLFSTHPPLEERLKALGVTSSQIPKPE